MSVPPVFLSQIFTRKSFAFAGNTLLLYDYLLTLPDEVAYIWYAPWTFVKISFLVNRYGNLIGQTFIMMEETGYLSNHSPKFCRAFLLYFTVFSFFSAESIRLLALLRTCAILGCKRNIAVVWSVAYITYALGICAALVVTQGSRQIFFQYLDEVGLCYSPVPPNLWKTWFIPLSLDGLMFGVVCFNLRQLIMRGSGRSPSPLIRLLARDTFLFYCSTLFNVLFAMLCLTVYSQDPRNFLAGLISYPFATIIGQRLVLNVRRFRGRSDTVRRPSEDVHRHGVAIYGEVTQPTFELRQVGNLNVRGAK